MKLLLPSIFCFLILACSPSAPSNQSKMDTSGYEVENVASGVDLVKKKNESGVLIESGILYNGVKSGTWTIYHSNGEPSIITPYANGLKNGMSVEFDEKGRVKKISNYANDEFHGNYKEYVSYIPVRESNFKNGKLHGLHKEYNEQGKLFRDMEFKDGIQDGKMNYYNLEGGITTTFIYKNGEKVEGGIVK